MEVGWRLDVIGGGELRRGSDRLVLDGLPFPDDVARVMRSCGFKVLQGSTPR